MNVVCKNTYPSVDEYPYKVGSVVYRTLSEAIDKAYAAKEAYPDALVYVVDRKSGTVVRKA